MGTPDAAIYGSCADETVDSFSRGNYRLAATKYLQSFQASPDRWEVNRWQIFHGFTSILTEEYFTASLENDINPLKDIVEDNKELKLFRIEAAFATGLLLWMRGNREEAADYYRHAIQLAEKIPKQEKKHKLVATVESPTGNHRLGFQSMGELIPGIVKVCTGNLQRMQAGISSNLPPPEHGLRSDGTPFPSTQRFTGVPVGHVSDDGSILSQAEVDKLIQVGGERCDCCGKSREELGRLFLDRCSGCSKAYYCNRDCQMKQWKAGHKKWCRKPGVFKPGDYVRLHGLQSQPQFNGTVVQVVHEDPNAKGLFAVKIQGGTKSVSISSEKMEQLRPLK
ncbi:unnamed protein product [Cylindrotheca closterium]|uniref:MYND-type domain-containing protein n=1 Tax=Cylindrotheca closterium TaxID=2856 RepID=A0AAD2CUY4_9STRA|nr:unnamed protein product [Cylindrotheca closterium]